MNEPLHPAQLQAFEKLKRLRVGALYIDRQEGKLKTVSELVKYRLRSQKIDGVLWLCTRRRVDLIEDGLARYAPAQTRCIEVCGIETLSHNLMRFLELMESAESNRLMLVIDNGLLIKNPEALRTKRVIALSGHCPYRLLISDMPFSGNIADLFSQWYALDWRILGYSTFFGFSLNHIRGKRKAVNTDYLTRAIEPYCAQIRRENIQNTAGRRELVWRFQLPTAAMEEYRAVLSRFVWMASGSTTGVYRMLQACQHVISGRRITRDYPLQTAPMYDDPMDNPRIGALLDVLAYYPGKRILILCRYAYDCQTVHQVLVSRFGAEQVGMYKRKRQELRRLTVMNIFADEREEKRLATDVILYYSNDWNWRKRQEKEQQCQNALVRGELTTVSLVAAETIDYQILKCVWVKDNLIRRMQEELAQNLRRTEDRHAKDL